ncbi:hypothetical protein Sste5346_005282 [Sporothrix stenoceras]|uniref:Uncharacterized protein n=1 Tax=Sporothrix stenoceras TaxID=5173 RepID=A0ABR3Z7G3_9PEZI
MSHNSKAVSLEVESVPTRQSMATPQPIYKVEARPVSPTPWANHTTLGICVYAVANTMIALHLMQVRGIQHSNVLVGVLWFVGGFGSWLVCVLELLKGNTFAYTVFGSFAGYYFAYAATLTPAFQIAAGYSSTEEYNNSLGVFFAVWATLFFFYFFVSFKTNVVFVWIFANVDATVWCLAAAYFQAGSGHAASALRLNKAAGGLLLAASMGGWYMLLQELMEGVGFTYSLPLGSLASKPKAVTDHEHLE